MLHSDAAIWADLSQRIDALAEVIGREPDAADVSERITETADALDVKRARVLRIYHERTAMTMGG